MKRDRFAIRRWRNAFRPYFRLNKKFAILVTSFVIPRRLLFREKRGVYVVRYRNDTGTMLIEKKREERKTAYRIWIR